MNRQRIVRGLRVAVSAVCLVAFVLLLGSWDSSFAHLSREYVQLPTAKMLQISSLHGRLTMATCSGRELVEWPEEIWNWGIGVRYGKAPDPPLRYSRFGFGWGSYPAGVIVAVPHWFPVFISAALAVAPWISWRFSLRTLLIVVTVVAVGLGIVVWFARR